MFFPPVGKEEAVTPKKTADGNECLPGYPGVRVEVKYGMQPPSVNGADLLGSPDQIGPIKAGYEADIIAVPEILSLISTP